MGIGPVELHRKGFIGRTVDWEAVYVDITLRREEVTRGTVEHGEITNPLELAIMGHSFDKGSRRRDWDGAGQIVGMLTRMHPARLAEGWTSEDVAALHELWQRWHLNAMRGECAHQDIVYEETKFGRTPSLDKTSPCPHSGYKYGHAWLVEPLPDAVVEQVRRFAGMLDGTDGLRHN